MFNIKCQSLVFIYKFKEIHILNKISFVLIRVCYYHHYLKSYLISSSSAAIKDSNIAKDPLDKYFEQISNKSDMYQYDLEAIN